MKTPNQMLFTDNKLQSIFYRKAYFDVENAITQVPFVTVVGPRTVGKTTILLQLKNKYGGNYTSFKEVSEDESDEVFQRIVDRLRSNEQTIEYLDEITYLDDYGRKLHYLASILPELAASGKTPAFHVVVTGSQELSITSNAAKAYGGRDKLVRVPFLTFGEYLIYRNHLSWDSDFTYKALSQTVTESDYFDFLLNGKSFYAGFTTASDYLRGCIDETINSEMKESWVSGSASVEYNDYTDVLAVVYSLLIKLHDRTRMKAAGDYDQLLKKVRTYYNLYHKDSRIKNVDFLQAINDTHFSAYKKHSLSKVSFMNILKFLHEMHLIEFVKPDLNDTDLNDFFHCMTEKWDTADVFLERYNPSFCNAQFFTGILEELSNSLKDISVMDLLDGSLLGSLVECCIRGSINTWSGTDNVELHNQNHAEVDCVVGNYAVEISTRNKQLYETHFDKFAEIKDYQKILLTESVLDLESDLWRIPYYLFQAHLDLAGVIIDKL